MKKSKLWLALVALFIVFVSAGCSNSNNSTKSTADYTTLMKQGKDHVANKEYSQAEDKFEDAHKVKATSEAKAYAKQADEMADAHDEISEYDFKDALKSLDKVINTSNGYSVMISQARKLDKSISEVQINIKDEIKPLYKEAKSAFKNKDYDQTVTLCQQILDLPYINGKYYMKVRDDTKDLLEDAKDEGGSQKASSNKNSTESSNNSSNTNSNKQASSANSKNDMTVDGQYVPDRVVAQVRNQLSSLGVDTTSWSNQEVVNFMNSAAKNGHTTIDSYDKNDVANFQK